MSPRLRAVALATCALLATGAAATALANPQPPKLLRFASAGERRTYLEAWDAWTREVVVYFGVGTALTMRSTLLSSDFREAMILERARQVEPSKDDYDAYIARMKRDLAAHHEIVFAADSGIQRRPMFGTSDDRWAVRLTADGVDQPLVRVDRITRPTPLQQALFPQLNIWSDLWVALFEKSVQKPTTVVLHVGSGYGNGEMVWTAPTPR